MDHLLHHCDRADDCGGSRNQADRRQGGPQDCLAVIIPNDQWSPSQQVEEEEEEDDWSEFMPSCQVFSAKSKAYEELDKWQSWWETYEADEIVDLCPNPKTMRMSPSKPPTPKKKKPQGALRAKPPAPPQEDKGPAEAAAPAEASAAAAQEEEAPAPAAAAAAQEDDAPAPPQEEEAPAAAPQEGEGAAPKEEEAPEEATPEGDPSPQEEGDAAPAATGAEGHKPEWVKEWEAGYNHGIRLLPASTWVPNNIIFREKKISERKKFFFSEKCFFSKKISPSFTHLSCLPTSRCILALYGSHSACRFPFAPLVGIVSLRLGLSPGICS